MAVELGKLPFSHFHFSNHDRPQISHDSFAEEDEFPILDFNSPNFGPELHSAARDFGFFQLINHGVRTTTIRGMQEQTKNFFSLPTEQKQLYRHAPGSRLGYRFGGFTHRHFWQEGLEFYDSPDAKQELVDKVWPTSSPEAQSFREAVDMYTDEVSALSVKLFEILATQLGVSHDSFTKQCSRDETVLRLYQYPPCPDPSVTLGIPPHHDKFFLTVLHQDEVGGLQVFRNERWIGLRPQPDAFIVNVGSALKVMSNDTYTSMLHRVVTNHKSSRISMVYPLQPRREAEIGPCIGDLSKYKPLPFHKFVEEIDRMRKDSDLK